MEGTQGGTLADFRRLIGGFANAGVSLCASAASLLSPLYRHRCRAFSQTGIAASVFLAKIAGSAALPPGSS
jgi:hypothetical protein